MRARRSWNPRQKFTSALKCHFSCCQPHEAPSREIKDAGAQDVLNVAGISRGIRGGLALPADEAEPAEMPNAIKDQDLKTDSTEVYIFEYEDPDELMNLDQDQYIEAKVTLDSGAVDHVANSNDLLGYTPTINPKAKNFVGANGDVIANMGEVEVVMEAPDTGTEIGSTFQLAKVTRALYSVSKMDDGGAEIRIKGGKASVFKGNQHITTFTREGGLYTPMMKLRKPKPSNVASEDFRRQGKK